MRRVMLLGLLALALPTAALASSTDPITINFALTSGGGVSFLPAGALGSATEFTFGPGPFVVVSAGSADQSGVVPGVTGISLSPTTISLPDNSGPISLTKSWTDSLGDFSEHFTSVTRGPSGNDFLALIFTGTLTAPGGIEEPITANLSANRTGTSLGWFMTEHAEGVSPIPEPGTLGLLGTGLVSLAGLARRKLKIGA